MPERIVTTEQERKMQADELETFRQLRHRCPHCRKSFANRTYARQHLSTCQKREANHGCRTCALLHPGENAEYTEEGRVSYPGCDQHCTVGIDLPSGHLRIHCPEWEPVY